MKTLEQLKNTPNLLIRRTGLDGGIGEIYQAGKLFCSVIWSFGGGWEHVSIAPYKRSHTPTWDEMCRVKDMFFLDNEVVIQFHPAKTDYVNNVSNCLHLWRSIDKEIPTPPSIMVGIKDGQTSEQIKQDIKTVLNTEQKEIEGDNNGR